MGIEITWPFIEIMYFWVNVESENALHMYSKMMVKYSIKRKSFLN